MNRYLLGGVIFAIIFGALLGVRAGNDVVGRGIQASRNAVSSNPAAASNLTPLEQAGQNVQRQSQTNATGNTVPNNTGAMARPGLRILPGMPPLAAPRHPPPPKIPFPPYGRSGTLRRSPPNLISWLAPLTF